MIIGDLRNETCVLIRLPTRCRHGSVILIHSDVLLILLASSFHLARVRVAGARCADGRGRVRDDGHDDDDNLSRDCTRGGTDGNGGTSRSGVVGWHLRYDCWTGEGTVVCRHRRYKMKKNNRRDGETR